jgi:hypothetical protein
MNDDIAIARAREAGEPRPCGSGRSTSFIPAVPAASSVTTIAFIRHLPVSSSRLLGEQTAFPRGRAAGRSRLARGRFGRSLMHLLMLLSGIRLHREGRRRTNRLAPLDRVGGFVSCARRRRWGGRGWRRSARSARGSRAREEARPLKRRHRGRAWRSCQARRWRRRDTRWFEPCRPFESMSCSCCLEIADDRRNARDELNLHRTSPPVLIEPEVSGQMPVRSRGGSVTRTRKEHRRVATCLTKSPSVGYETLGCASVQE